MKNLVLGFVSVAAILTMSACKDRGSMTIDRIEAPTGEFKNHALVYAPTDRYQATVSYEAVDKIYETELKTFSVTVIDQTNHARHTFDFDAAALNALNSNVPRLEVRESAINHPEVVIAGVATYSHTKTLSTTVYLNPRSNVPVARATNISDTQMLKGTFVLEMNGNAILKFSSKYSY
jgi:hypothetical protein